MFSHVTIGTNDMKQARQFYDATLATIGHVHFADYEGVATGYGTGEGNQTWLMAPFDEQPASVGNGMMIGFLAPDRASVDAFYVAAMANGGTDEGGPGLRPHYHADYYAAYMRDSDDNKLCVVCHKPE
ncbi:MAG: VOC family protein [Rhodospirillales bacterium]|jgi:catechol 2,3-dioxygenase-like lactoylglutathione lyase family enzyme|nr:VOC family protein [Rhodospirillales bacterium]